MVIELTSEGIAHFEQGEVVRDGGGVRAHLAIVRESDGGFSAIVLNLPGCGSQGDSEEESVANVREAIRETVKSYEDDGIDIPWDDSMNCDDIPDGAKLKWIMVHV